VPPAEPVPPTTPEVPDEDRLTIEGSDGRDRMKLNHIHSADVELGRGRDTVKLGDDHSDVSFIFDQGEARGDRIKGFQEGDMLLFRGFDAETAEVEFLHGDRVRVSDSSGSETFRVHADHDLTASDYAFI
jgi:hypothetical protein